MENCVHLSSLIVVSVCWYGWASCQLLCDTLCLGCISCLIPVNVKPEKPETKWRGQCQESPVKDTLVFCTWPNKQPINQCILRIKQFQFYLPTNVQISFLPKHSKPQINHPEAVFKAQTNRLPSFCLISASHADIQPQQGSETCVVSPVSLMGRGGFPRSPAGDAVPTSGGSAPLHCLAALRAVSLAVLW